MTKSSKQAKLSIAITLFIMRMTCRNKLSSGHRENVSCIHDIAQVPLF
jgi:hypothetical protein